MRLFIIGNGFDLAHGLKTTYGDFRKYLEENSENFLYGLEYMYGFCRESNKKYVEEYLWRDFEKNLGYINEGEIIDFGTGIEMGLEGGDIDIENTLDIYWEEQYNFIKELNDYVEKWIESIELNTVKRSKIIKVENDDVFLTFNYTTLLEEIYGIEHNNILHIHGSLDRWYGYKPVIGHGEYSKIIEMKEQALEAQEEYFEKEASIYKAIANYYERTLKDTQYFKSINNQFFRSLNDVTEIFIIGHSLGDVDRIYFQEIMKNVNDEIKWNVSYHEEKDRDKYKNSILSLGVKEENINMLHTNEFFEIQG